MRFLLALLLLCLPAFGQSSSVSSTVPTTAEMKARVPRLGEVIAVKGRSAAGDWGTDVRQFVAVASNPLLPLDEVDYFTTGSTNYLWESTDRNAYERWVTWGNVKRDGTTDDTAAIQYMVDSSAGRVLRFPGGDYRVAGTVTVSDGLKIEGTSRRVNWLGTGQASGAMLYVTASELQVSDINFNGRLQSHKGIEVADGVEKLVVRSCVFTNFQESASHVTAIGVEIHGETEVTIENCNFEDIYGFPDEIIGNPTGTGFAHGVYLNRVPFTYAGPPKRVLIQGCVFRRILPGEDSDAIRWTDSTWTYRDANVEVSHCFFEDIGKRCIKASGSGGLFIGNTFTNSFDGSVQATGWVDVSGLKEQYSCISLYGRNHRVIGNKFHGGRIRHFIDTTVEAANCLISGNEFLLSTNWGLNGTTSGTSGFGTIGISCYMSQGMSIVNNALEAVQYGIWFWNPVSDSTIIGNIIRSPGPDGSTTNGVGRGIRFGRYATNYPPGALSGNMVVANRIHNFRGGIDISESTNTFLAANHVTQTESPLLLNKTAPDGVVWENMLSGGVSGAFKLYRPLYLHSENADQIVSTPDRGQTIWDSLDKLPAFYDGRKWASPDLGTRVSTTSGLQSTNWYRVAELNAIGFGTRGSARITIGSGGGYSSSSAEFNVGMNYSDAQIVMTRNWAYAAGTGNPIGHVRVVRNIGSEKAYFDFQPFANLNSIVAAQVVPDWTTQAGLEPTNSWKSIAFTRIDALDAGDAISATISNLNTKIVAFNGNSKSWSIGLDTMDIGDGRFRVEAPALNVDTPLSMVISNNVQKVKRDPFTGVLYATPLNVATGDHTHVASNITSGTFVGERLGTGTPSTNLVLWGGGSGQQARWQTIPSTSSPTNGIADAPSDGSFYGRRNNAWTTPAIADVSGLQPILDDAVTYSTTATEGFSAYGITSTAGLSAYDLPWLTPDVNLSPLVIDEAGFSIGKMTTSNFVAQIGAALSGHQHVIADTTNLQSALDGKAGLTLDNDMTGWNTLHGATIDRRADGQRPVLWFYSASAPSIAKRWGISIASGGLFDGTGTTYNDFNFEVPSDSGDPTFAWMTAKRSANDISSVDWYILNKRMRINGSWVVTDALTNGVTYGRQNGAWVAVTPATTFAFTNILADPGVVLRTNAGTLYIGSRSPVVFGSSADVTVPTGTLAETSVLGALRAGESKIIPANSMAAGAIYKLEASGVFTSPPANWDGGVVRAKFGNLVVSFTIHDADSWQPNGWEWNTVVYVTVKTTGVAATVSVGGRLDYNYSVAGSPLQPARENPTASGTLDTTAANTVDLTFQNNPGQPIDFTCRAAILQRY